ncbi:MAG: hypothetical protein ABIO63_13140, partial [Casimicrobiaceae bacterium]
AASFAAIASLLALLAAFWAAPAACDAAAASAGAVDGVVTITGGVGAGAGVTTTGVAGRLSQAASVSATIAVYKRVLFIVWSFGKKEWVGSFLNDIVGARTNPYNTQDVATALSMQRR